MSLKDRGRKALGSEGEDLACRYLQQKGYEIVFRNFRCRLGEIDIIALKDDILCFIEVKTRKSQKYGTPAEAVTFSKQRRIYRCAEYYMQAKGIINNMPVLSFDVIEIVKDGDAIKSFRHFPHCF